MRSETFNQLVKPTQFIMTILWVALLLSVFVYIVIGFLVTSGNEPRALDGVMVVVLAACAVGCAGASFIVPQMMFSPERIRKHMRSNEVDLEAVAKNPQTQSIDEDKLAKLESMSEIEQRLVGLPALYFAPFILGLALLESVGIFGLILTFLSQDVTYVIPFSGAAIVLMILRRPRLEAIFERAERLSR